MVHGNSRGVFRCCGVSVFRPEVGVSVVEVRGRRPEVADWMAGFGFVFMIGSCLHILSVDKCCPLLDKRRNFLIFFSWHRWPRREKCISGYFVPWTAFLFIVRRKMRLGMPLLESTEASQK